MKKICFLSGDMSRSGGTERVLAIIANELCKKEDLFEIHILSTINENMTSFFPLDKRIKQSRILNDKALDRRFEKIYLNEPNDEELENLLMQVKCEYEKYHNVIVTKRNIDDIIFYSNK